MCRAVRCKTCQKTTWAGCGNHVDSVMRNVPKNDRCSCDRNARAAGPAKPGLLARLFGRA